MYLDDDINSTKALTPALFLSINGDVGVPDLTVNENNFHNLTKYLLQTWKRGQGYLNSFWHVWRDEYLKSLRETHTLKMKPIKGEVNRVPNLGEVVILKEDGMPRGRWKLACIENLIKSDIDGICRAARLQMPSGKILRRPFRLIYPLEGSIWEDNVNRDKKNDNRPKRNAAIIAKKNMQGIK